VQEKKLGEFRSRVFLTLVINRKEGEDLPLMLDISREEGREKSNG